MVGAYLFNKDVYFITDYSESKGYFNRTVEKFNEKLVFIKVSGEI